MVASLNRIPEGRIKRIYIWGQRIRQNKQDGGDRPPISVRMSDETHHFHEVSIKGESRLVYDGGKLSSGAVLWIETTAEVWGTWREQDEHPDS